MTIPYYTLALIFGAGSWFIIIIEKIATHAFLRLAFNVGIPIIKKTIELPTNDFKPKINITIEETEGKFRFTADRKVLFLSQFFWFKAFRFNSIFPFKMVGTINEDNTINLIVRLPLGPSLFLMFWLIACTINILEVGFQYGGNGSISLGLAGLIFAAIITVISYQVEKNRLETMMEELRKIINRTKKI